MDAEGVGGDGEEVSYRARYGETLALSTGWKKKGEDQISKSQVIKTKRRFNGEQYELYETCHLDKSLEDHTAYLKRRNVKFRVIHCKANWKAIYVRTVDTDKLG